MVLAIGSDYAKCLDCAHTGFILSDVLFSCRLETSRQTKLANCSGLLALFPALIKLSAVFYSGNLFQCLAYFHPVLDVALYLS